MLTFLGQDKGLNLLATPVVQLWPPREFRVIDSMHPGSEAFSEPQTNQTFRGQKPRVLYTCSSLGLEHYLPGPKPLWVKCFLRTRFPTSCVNPSIKP